jgi:hypothetical protein
MSAKGLDPESYRIGRFTGSVFAWSEAARGGAKKMSLSSPFPPEDHDLLIPYVERATEENQVRFHLEKNLMTTDLFADFDMEGRWVFIIYKEEKVLEDYLALKAEKESLEKEGGYVGETRKRIARGMGSLLGYSDDYIEERLERVASYVK